MGAFGASGMFHRPLLGFRLPRMMTCPSLMILTSYLLKRATQSSSQSWPMEMREPDWRLSKMCPVLACVDNSGARGTMTRLVVSMVSPLATWTEGPFEVGVTFVQCVSAAVSK